MQGSEGSSPEDDAGASEDAGDPDGVPSPDDVDRALKRLWSGDASSLERLVPANRDEIPLDRVAKGLRVAPVPPPRPATDETPVPVEVRGYTILHSIGRGGMGDVFLAEQHHPRRSVALKVARTGRERDAARDHLLVHEAQMLARLQHPWIATIYDVGETDDGRRTIAMEPVEGTRLDRWLQAENRPLRTRLELFRKLCAAVHYAHEQGVVHRDLKPTNVLVDRGGDPKILDFGLAQDREAAQPLDPMFLRSGRLIGTLPYMSPEQVTGRFEEVDRRSDVYSLGVMLYQALTGRLPYPIHADRPGEAVRAICELPPTPPRVLDRRIPPAVEAIVLRALQKARGDRYATAADMQQDLAQSLQAVALRGTGGSVPTRPETWSPPFLATVLLGFVALGLGLGAAVTKALSTDRRPRAGTVDESAEATRGTSHFYNQAIAALDVVDLDPARPNESMLDLLADRLAADAQLSPRARARLCIHLARRYESRELLDRAVLLYERAFELRLLEFGEASERTRNVLVALARLRLRLGHLAAAEAAARSLLATSLAAEGESPATQRARRLLADVLDASGQSEEAAALRAAIVDEDPAAAPGDADADADEE